MKIYPKRLKENNKWKFVYSEIHTLIQNEVFLIGFTKFRKIPGILKTILYVNKKGWQTCYTTQKELDRIRKQGKVFLNVEYRQRFDKEINKCVRKFSQFYQKFTKINLASLSSQKLLSLFDEYVINLSLMFAYYQIGGGRSYPLLEENIKTKLFDYINKDEIETIYSLILKSPELDILEKEEIDLLKLVCNDKVSKTNLITHSKKYAFRFFNTFNEKEVLSALEERIQKIKKQCLTLEKYSNLIIQKKNDLKQSQNKIFSAIENKELTSQIKYLQEQARLRLEYKNWKNGAEYKFLNLFKEISTRIGISVKDFLFSYTLDETRTFLKNKIKISNNYIQQRKNIFILLKDQNKRQFLFGEKTNRFLLIAKIDHKKTKQELKGIVASPGYAKGIAKIIFFKSVSELLRESKHFKKGEILITTMTQPDMVPLIKKAAAIITDQGGITSHAAVIAREFRIPCIVRTYEATQVFRNGDLIEVDASNGIIRKIIK